MGLRQGDLILKGGLPSARTAAPPWSAATGMTTSSIRNHTKHIPYTDFPVDEITLWFANNTIYLPSEH